MEQDNYQAPVTDSSSLSFTPAEESEAFFKCQLHKSLLHNESMGTRIRESRVSKMTPEDSRSIDHQETEGVGGGGG